jgi:REP element-mobilizing transposase RayT
MKCNPIRYSSAVGEVWTHFMFKVKYCHKIFDNFGYRNAMNALLRKALRKYEIRCRDDEIGFDNNHVHMEIDLGLRSKPQIAKLLKGYTARKFFKLFPELKLPRAQGGLFWASGLWSPAYFGNSSSGGTLEYIKRQKYGSHNTKNTQQKLAQFFA